MRIQNNIMAMNTHRMYTSNNNSVSKSAEKLSSGYRINRAGDDAAGLAISEKMRAQVRGLNMASKNSQDAISLVQTAEGALQEVHSMLQRMNELSVQSATGTNADFDRTQIAAEFEQLKGEIDQIAETTNFNNKVLLDGSLAGVGSASFIKATDVASPIVSSVTNGTISGSTTIAEIDLSKLAIGDVLTLGDADYTITKANTIDNAEFASEIAKHTGTNATVTYDADKNKITVTSGADNADITVASKSSVARTSIALTGNLDHGAGFSITKGTTTKNFRLKVGDEAISGFNSDNDVEVKVAVGATKEDVAKAFAEAINGDADFYAVGEFEASGVGGAVSISGSDVTESVAKTYGGGLQIQVGAEEGNTLNVSVDAMNSEALGLKSITIDTQAKAGDAITATRHAVDVVSDMRARLGAMQNRLDHKISNLDNTAENLQAAESRIRDVDIAKEMTNYTKSNILSQASTAMLAQANAAPQNVLSLLQ